MEEFPPYLEEEEEGEEDWASKIKHEVIEFILQRYSLLSAPDMARVLGWKVREVNRVLRNLENFGRVKRTKLGRTYVWTHIEEHRLNPMYY